MDAGLVGVEEARRRVLAHWAKGATLRHVDATRWLLTLPVPVTVRSELAPGFPLVAAGGGYAVPDTGGDLPAGVVRLLEGGAVVERELTSMPDVDVTRWVGLAGLTRTALTAAEPPPPLAAPPPPPEAPPAVDLRKQARIDEASKKAAEVLADIEREYGDRRGHPGGGRWRRGGDPLQRPPKAPLKDLMAKAAWRSPLAGQLGRRHAKYLDDLEKRLRNGDFDALRDALPLLGHGAFLTLRVPRRRDSALRPSTRHPVPGGGVVPYGSTVLDHLGELYRDAARVLEQQGRIDEAAYVLADLIGVVREAVALLAETDPAQAVELRAQWARNRAMADDLVGAVEVAWPEESLRAGAATYVRAGIELGGPRAAHLLAYLLALDPSEQVTTRALALLGSRDPAVRAARDAFVTALATVPATDPEVDRVVCSAAVRALVRGEPPALLPDRSRKAVVNALRDRADPLLREDAPTPAGPRRGAVARAVLPEGRGELAVHDVVPLPNGLLVAYGEHGVRLLDLTGRVRHHWDTPAHAIVPSDSGGTAVVASAYGRGSWELHRLDVATRRLRRWLPLRARGFAPSYDGDLLPVLAMDGSLDFLDTHADNARVLWRELNTGEQTIALARTPTSMAAVVLLPAGHGAQERVEVWRWDLPERILRSRSRLTFEEEEQWVLLTTGQVPTVRPAPQGAGPVLTWHPRASSVPAVIPWPHGVLLLASGSTLGIVRHGAQADEPAHVDLTADAPGPVDVTVTFPELADGLDVRTFGDLTAVWDEAGRIAVVEVATQRVLATLRSRV